jgi:hypothetical protein
VSRRSRLPVAGAATIAILGSLGGTAIAAPGPEQLLVRAYAPVVMLRAQRDPPCDDSEEQYEPTTIDVMLGNRRVRLLPPGGSAAKVKRAPGVADVAGRGPGYHLDVPGDALNAGCTYAKDFRTLVRSGRAPPVIYARIAREAGKPGFVVQYWFFYYFNQFNDVHEGDWEGMQIAFDANTASQALARGPTEIALFQHGGGERADWGDARVEKEGTHPVVYPAAGSHATFFESAVFVENGQGGSGLGCDNTSEPLRRVRPVPVLIPTNPTSTGRFAWLTYFGHWGEKQKGYNNGPTGPITKRQWNEPFTWMDGLRKASPKLPGGALAGPAVTGAFCGVVASLSTFVNLEAQSTLGAIVLVMLVLAIVVVAATMTRWRPIDLANLRRPRAFGQLVTAPAGLYARHWRTVVPIGLASLAIIAVVAGVDRAFVSITGIGDGGTPTASGGAQLDLADPVAAIGRPIGFAIIAGVLITFVRELADGRPAGAGAAFRGTLDRFWRLAFCQLLATVAVVLIALTIIGIPYAVKKYVDWQFVQQEIVFKNASIRDAFRGSTRLVRRRWWRTVRVAGFFWLLSVVTGPMLGFALIFANLSLPVINLFGSLIFALLTPYVVIGRTLLYFDLGARREGALVPEPEARRRWLPRRRPSPQPG